MGFLDNSGDIILDAVLTDLMVLMTRTTHPDQHITI